jgi:hypothetical protein
MSKIVLDAKLDNDFIIQNTFKTNVTIIQVQRYHTIAAGIRLSKKKKVENLNYMILHLESI